MIQVRQGFGCRDNLLPEKDRKRVEEFLDGGWKFGWKSNRKSDTYRFWHRHFAGTMEADYKKEYDCAAELAKNAPLMAQFWQFLAGTLLRGHTLVRCYANAFAYGNDGTLHTDSRSPTSFTTIYYPHERWSPNWGGETVFFNPEETDIIAVVYPKPNRLLTFPGTVPHVARGLSRMCPALRTTLMFKTDYGRSTSQVPA